VIFNLNIVIHKNLYYQSSMPLIDKHSSTHAFCMPKLLSPQQDKKIEQTYLSLDLPYHTILNLIVQDGVEQELTALWVPNEKNTQLLDSVEDMIHIWHTWSPSKCTHNTHEQKKKTDISRLESVVVLSNLGIRMLLKASSQGCIDQASTSYKPLPQSSLHCIRPL